MFSFAIVLTPCWDWGGIGVRVEIVDVYSDLLRVWPDQMGLLVAVVGNVLALKGWGGFAIYLFRPRFDPASRDNWNAFVMRSDEHTSELQSLMRISYAVFCFKKKMFTYDAPVT